RRAAVGSGARVARTFGAVGTVVAALAVRRRHMDARRGVRRTRRRRLSMVRTFQADDRNAIRVVGHLALRPALRPARTRGPAGRHYTQVFLIPRITGEPHLHRSWILRGQ